MNTITQVSVFLENKVGTLATVCEALARADVSLVALSIAVRSDYGIARLIVDDPAKAVDALKKAKNVVKTTPVVAIAVPDAPGGMATVVKVLSERGCDIEYAYAFAARRAERAILVFRFKDDEQAAATLATLDFEMLTEADLNGSAAD